MKGDKTLQDPCHALYTHTRERERERKDLPLAGFSVHEEHFVL